MKKKEEEKDCKYIALPIIHAKEDQEMQWRRCDDF
jgi:hypothetical protein